MTEPVTFSFGQLNPLTGAPYARSYFDDLPGYAASVVTDAVHLCAGVWDELVTMGETADFVELDQPWKVDPAQLTQAHAAAPHHRVLGPRWRRDDADTVAVIGW